MFIPSLLLNYPELAIDYCNQVGNIFNVICLQENEELPDFRPNEDYYDFVSQSCGSQGYGAGYCDFFMLNHINDEDVLSIGEGCGQFLEIEFEETAYVYCGGCGRVSYYDEHYYCGGI